VPGSFFETQNSVNHLTLADYEGRISLIEGILKANPVTSVSTGNDLGRDFSTATPLPFPIALERIAFNLQILAKATPRHRLSGERNGEQSSCEQDQAKVFLKHGGTGESESIHCMDIKYTRR